MRYFMQLVSQRIVRQVARNIAEAFTRDRVIAQRSGKLLEIVAERTVFSKRVLQLDSQRFRPLQGMSHCGLFRGTYLAMALRDKSHEKCNSA